MLVMKQNNKRRGYSVFNTNFYTDYFINRDIDCDNNEIITFSFNSVDKIYFTKEMSYFEGNPFKYIKCLVDDERWLWMEFKKNV